VKSRLRRGSRGGSPPAFDAAAYKQRNVIERAFCHLRQHRAVATRYDKCDYVWRATVDVASIRIWLRLIYGHALVGRSMWCRVAVSASEPPRPDQHGTTRQV
jgi:hypothetical protein